MIGKVDRALALVAMAAMASVASAGIVTVFEDKPLFASLLGDVTAIDFVAPDGVEGWIPADTYSSLGLTLSSSPTSPFVQYYRGSQPGGYVDGWGLHLGSQPPFILAFDFASPIHGFAAERLLTTFNGPTCTFFLDGQIVGQNTFPMPPVSSGTYFVGWVTDFQFDRVTFDFLGVDNIYFQTVPGPGIAALVALGLLRTRRCRT